MVQEQGRRGRRRNKTNLVELENHGSSIKMNTEGLSLDIISTLPPPVIEYILTLMPLRDAVRTSVLSTKWRYFWRSMPRLAFQDNMVVRPSDDSGCTRQLITAILRVLLLHKGPTAVEFYCSVLGLEADFDFILTHLSSTVKTVNKFYFVAQGDYDYYYLHHTFFDFQGLEYIYLKCCFFRSPSTFNGFKRLKTAVFCDVEITAETFLSLLSQCPLLVQLALTGFDGEFDLSGVEDFTFVDLLRCVPLIETLLIWNGFFKNLCRGGLPHKLPASLFHLKTLCLHVCLTERDEISAALCIIGSSPVLEDLCIVSCDYEDTETETLPVGQTLATMLDPKTYSDLKLDHLVSCWIRMFSNLPLEVELVKLIMANSPVLETLRIELLHNISDDEVLKMQTDLLRLPCASPSVELIIQDFDVCYWVIGF